MFPSIVTEWLRRTSGLPTRLAIIAGLFLSGGTRFPLPRVSAPPAQKQCSRSAKSLKMGASIPEICAVMVPKNRYMHTLLATVPVKSPTFVFVCFVFFHRCVFLAHPNSKCRRSGGRRISASPYAAPCRRPKEINGRARHFREVRRVVGEKKKKNTRTRTRLLVCDSRPSEVWCLCLLFTAPRH